MKNLCLSPKLLERYFDEEVSPEERTLVENHLTGCSNCQERLKFMRALREALKEPVEMALEKETFPWIWEKIEREIQKEPESSWWEMIRLRLNTLPIFQKRVWIPALATLMVLLLVSTQILFKKIPSYSEGTVVKYIESSSDVMIYQLEKPKVTIIWLFEESENEASS